MQPVDQEKAVQARPRPASVASVRNLRVYFQSKRGMVHAVDGVSFDIYDGETLGLVGETGCGKSVTGRSFLKLLPVPPGKIASGSIQFKPHATCRNCDGNGCPSCEGTGRQSAANSSGRSNEKGIRDSVDAEIVELLEIGREEMRRIRGDRIAMIFQDPGKALNPTLPISEQLSEVFLLHRTSELLEAAGLPASTGGALRRFASQEQRFGDSLLMALPPNRAFRNRLVGALNKMVIEALGDTQVPNPAKLMARYPHELSGGMKQRVMIAQALACNPDILIADEPTTALDVTVEARILELIKELQKKRRTSVLYISHDLSLVRRICDRVAVMYAGKVVEIGSTDAIFWDPRHPYTRGLISAVPSAGARRGELAAIRGTVPELVDPAPTCRFAGRCPFEADSCRRFEPELKPVSNGHAVACFIDSAAPSGRQPTFQSAAV